MRDENTTRQILLSLGIGDFNATMLLPMMFMAPAQTDPGMTQVKIMTRAMQKMMRSMGATWLVVTGEIDTDTAHCLHAIAGPAWNSVSWFELGSALVTYKRAGKRLQKNYLADHKGGVVLEGLGLLPDLPSVPGGIITYGVVGYLLYRHFFKR